MNWLEQARLAWAAGERDYYFYPPNIEPDKTVKRFLEVMGNNEPGFITVFNRDELVLAILFYDQFSAEQMSYRLGNNGEWIQGRNIK